MKGFLQRNWAANGCGNEKVEIVVVTHGSFLRKLVSDGKSSQRRAINF